jgi:hypothetical protein
MKNIRFVLLALVIIAVGSLAYSDGLLPYATVKIDQNSTNNTVKLSTSGNTVKMDSTTNTVKIDGTTNTVKMDATTNSVKEDTYSSIQSTHTTATTTAGGIGVTPLTGRDYIEFRVASSTPAFHLFVSVGSTTAEIDGSNTVTVSYGTPFKIKAPASVAFGVIASDALIYDIIQAAY